MPGSKMIPRAPPSPSLGITYQPVADDDGDDEDDAPDNTLGGVRIGGPSDSDEAFLLQGHAIQEGDQVVLTEADVRSGYTQPHASIMTPS